MVVFRLIFVSCKTKQEMSSERRCDTVTHMYRQASHNKERIKIRRRNNARMARRHRFCPGHPLHYWVQVGCAFFIRHNELLGRNETGRTKKRGISMRTMQNEGTPCCPCCAAKDGDRRPDRSPSETVWTRPPGMTRQRKNGVSLVFLRFFSPNSVNTRTGFCHGSSG